MHVLLDATAVPADRGGVGRYVDDLVPELVAAGVKLTMVVQQRDLETYSRIAPGAHLIAAPPWIERRLARMVWEQVGLSRIVRRVRPDVLHCPHYTLPVLVRIPIVVTLHDATFFTMPEMHLRSKAWFFRTAIKLASRRAAALVAPSLATRDEVLRLVGGAREKYFVAYHGVDTEQFHATSADERERVRTSLGVDGRYIAFLGTLEPRKNVSALIRGWVGACADLDSPPALILAGGRGWDETIDPEIAKVPPHLSVRRAGYLPLEDLPGFLGGATVVAYPSLGEGFGLPVLEAMACGATVLTTRELSLPEVGGDAVAYCGTRDQEIAEALARLLDDDAERERLAADAMARAREFTWERAAHVHVEAYEAAARFNTR